MVFGLITLTINFTGVEMILGQDKRSPVIKKIRHIRGGERAINGKTVS